MSRVIRVHAVGDAGALSFESADVAAPAAGEVQLRHTAIGVNFIDVYHRTGLYPLPLPFIPGQEGAGVVTALGEGVTSLRVGQRVAYAGLSGAYSEVRNAKAERLIALPDDISDTVAASVMLKGMTAEALLRRCHPVSTGHSMRRGRGRRAAGHAVGATPRRDGGRRGRHREQGGGRAAEL